MLYYTNRRLHMRMAVPHSLNATQVAYILPSRIPQQTAIPDSALVTFPFLMKNKPIVIVRGALRRSLHYPNCNTEYTIPSAFPSSQPIIITHRSSWKIQGKLIGRAGFDCEYVCAAAPNWSRHLKPVFSIIWL